MLSNESQKKVLSLRRYIIRRVLYSIPLVLIVIIINFLIIHLAPGDPATILAGENAPLDVIERIRDQLKLDQPLYIQLIVYMCNIIRLDFGYSYSTNTPVISMILDRIPATLLLVTLSTIIALIIGIIAGVISSKKVYSLTDNIVTTSSLIAFSMPNFWLGMILILIFGLYLGIFPIAGMITLRVSYTGLAYIIDVIMHLILPAIALGLSTLAIYYRMTRASMLEELKKDYVTTAWAKGLTEFQVLYGHAIRNALLPIVTVLGMRIGYIFSGSVIIETVFGWPGMGRLTFFAIGSRDYPLLMGIFTIVSITVIVVNLLTDILYYYIDPRIRFQ